MTAWQQWLQHPERSWVRRALFQIHLWVGAGLSAYIFLMSVSGSVIVYRNELSRNFSIEWLVNFHANLASGPTGRSACEWDWRDWPNVSLFDGSNYICSRSKPLLAGNARTAGRSSREAPYLNNAGSALVRRVVAMSPRGMQLQASGRLTHQNLHLVKLAVILCFHWIIAQKVLTS